MTLLKRSLDPKSRQLHEVEPFSEIGPYYVEIMEYVDYFKWSVFLSRIFNQQHVNVKSLMMFGCRTGHLMIELFERGIDVDGVDFHLNLVQWAKGFTDYKGYNFDYYASDMKKKPPVKPKDCVLAMHGSINYLMTETDLAEFFSNARLLVKPGGCFIFDAYTEVSSINHYSNFVDHDRIAVGFYVHKAYYEAQTKIQNHIYELYPGDAPIMLVEHHKTKMWDLGKLEEVANSHGFKVKNIFNKMGFQPVTEETEYAHFVAVPV